MCVQFCRTARSICHSFVYTRTHGSSTCGEGVAQTVPQRNLRVLSKRTRYICIVACERQSRAILWYSIDFCILHKCIYILCWYDFMHSLQLQLIARLSAKSHTQPHTGPFIGKASHRPSARTLAAIYGNNNDVIPNPQYPFARAIMSDHCCSTVCFVTCATTQGGWQD